MISAMKKCAKRNNIELCKLPQKHKNAYAYYRTIYSFLKKRNQTLFMYMVAVH